MAKKSVVKSCYIVDTSYLLELFGVPGWYDEWVQSEVQHRFKMAAKEGSIIFVPVPCLFELGNQIGHIQSGRKRREFAKRLYDAVEISVGKAIPWSITPSASLEILPLLCKSFLDSPKGIGLTDWFTVDEAHRIKKKYNSYAVHIWTKDAELKSHEPDREANPFPD